MSFTPYFRALSLTLGLLGLHGVARADELCFQSGQTCMSAAALAGSGVASVRFQPLSLRRDTNLTAWKLYAYRANGTFLPQLIEARWPAYVQGEDQVLALQDDLCEVLVAAGVGCTSDFFDGTYIKTNGAMFEVSFKNESHTDLTAKGHFTTKRWSCKADQGTVTEEVEVSCAGTYVSSRRLLYLTNGTFLAFSDVACTETARRPASSPPLTRRCPADGVFSSADWLPTGAATVNVSAQGPGRVISSERQISLLRR